MIALTMLMAVETNAQQSSSPERTVRQSERVARASWQPTRSVVGQGEAVVERGAPRHSDEDAVVRTVDYTGVEDVPAPMPDSNSIIEQRVDVVPLDGQISLTPLFKRSVACDALPAGECGCGEAACDGGCNPPLDAIGACGSCGEDGCVSCGELCSPEAWRPCITLHVPQDGWFSLDFLGWWQDGMNLPPLVTTSTNPSISRDQAGVLTDPATRVLFGGGDVLEDELSGSRVRFGVWLNRRHTWGVGAELFQLDTESESLTGVSNGNPILARPFFNTQTGVEDSGIVAYPGVASGTVTAAAASRLRGGSFNFRYLRCCNEGYSRWLFCGCPERFCSRTEQTFGLRFLDLEEAVSVRESMISTDPTSPGSLDLGDQFDTRNQFSGLDIGWSYRRVRKFWSVDGMLRLAAGNTRQTVTIRGQTVVNDPTNTPTVQTLPGGLLAQTSNIGMYRQNEFTVVPEINTNIAYQLTEHWKLSLGYTAIYWSNVIRAGDQISRDLNPNLLPPPAVPFTGTQRPAFAFDTTDYWVQGINFGGEYRW
jgi:hypothetical protein